jgi:hypothetical protein
MYSIRVLLEKKKQCLLSVINHKAVENVVINCIKYVKSIFFKEKHIAQQIPK